MQKVLKFLLQMVLLAAGLVFAAGLAVLFMGLMLVAGLRLAWARITGRPIAGFVFHIDPRAGFNRFYRAGQGVAPASARSEEPGPGRRVLPGAGEISDVEPKGPDR
jgi:hypothetical protein